MDDEAIRLLREIRDIAVREDARNEAWISEMRSSIDRAKRNNSVVASAAFAITIILVPLLAVLAWLVYQRLG